MELSPQSVALTTFKTVKKGYDPQEVRAYLSRLATAIESTQTQAAAMEARARAAVARLQELAAQPSQQAAAKPAEPAVSYAPAAEREATADEAQTISRTLLLAQRTADATIAEANAEAKRIKEEAEAVAQRAIDSAKEVQTRLLDEARVEARRASEDQRVQIDSEVQSLLARREFLLSDVEVLELHMATHRERLRDVASTLTTIADSAVGGLADIRRPLISAVGEDDAPLDETMPIQRVPALGASSEIDADTDADAGPGVDPAEADAGDGGADDGSAHADAADVGVDGVDGADGVDDGAGASDGDGGETPLGDLTPPSGTASPADVENTQVVPTVPRLGNSSLFSVSGEELR